MGWLGWISTKWVLDYHYDLDGILLFKLIMTNDTSLVAMARMDARIPSVFD